MSASVDARASRLDAHQAGEVRQEEGAGADGWEGGGGGRGEEAGEASAVGARARMHTGVSGCMCSGRIGSAVAFVTTIRVNTGSSMRTYPGGSGKTAGGWVRGVHA